MSNISKFARPALSEALNAWKTVLAEQHLPTESVWLLDENLYFERDSRNKGRLKTGFQIQFTPPPPGAERITYDFFCETGARLVFYRLGSSGGKSICMMLCDDWFESKDRSGGFIRRDDWRMSFRPGGAGEIEEITDEQRWKNRILRDRPLHDLDFCMTMRDLHEIMAHGYALSPYERYALKFLHSWRKLLGQTG